MGVACSVITCRPALECYNAKNNMSTQMTINNNTTRVDQEAPTSSYTMYLYAIILLAVASLFSLIAWATNLIFVVFGLSDTPFWITSLVSLVVFCYTASELIACFCRFFLGVQRASPGQGGHQHSGQHQTHGRSYSARPRHTNW